MIRICPKRDAVCPHGDNCPYSIDRYTCGPEDKTTLPEPVAYVSEKTAEMLKVMSPGASPFHLSNTPFMRFTVPLYTATALQEALDRLVEAEKATLAILTALEHHTGERHGIMAIRQLADRATTAEAAIESARKVIEGSKLALMVAAAQYPGMTEDLNAASQWLSANQKETPNADT